MFVADHEMTLIDALEIRPRLLPLISTSNFYLRQYHNINEKTISHFVSFFFMESISTLRLQQNYKKTSTVNLWGL